jgi:hypothetical protein
MLGGVATCVLGTLGSAPELAISAASHANKATGKRFQEGALMYFLLRIACRNI